MLHALAVFSFLSSVSVVGLSTFCTSMIGAHQQEATGNARDREYSSNTCLLQSGYYWTQGPFLELTYSLMSTPYSFFIADISFLLVFKYSFNSLMISGNFKLET